MFLVQLVCDKIDKNWGPGLFGMLYKAPDPEICRYDAEIRLGTSVKIFSCRQLEADEVDKSLKDLTGLGILMSNRGTNPFNSVQLPPG